MSSIHCHDLTKRFGQLSVLDQVCWSVAAGQTVGLLGGSGAGKTTLLRLVAGLARCTSGTLIVGASSADPPRVSMVFQNLALWPHLTARQHLECVLFRLPLRDRRRRAEALLSEARLPAEVWRHRPAQLSGGEAQRLALARALAVEPDVLLLDEPLAHLDPPLRSELLQVIRECVGSRGMTCVFVTHSWDEAVQFCSRIAVLDRGRLVQEGSPADLYWRPRSAAVAHWSGPVVQLRQSWLTAGCLGCAGETGHLAITAAGPDELLVRPQQLTAVGATGENRWQVVDSRPRAGGWWTTARRDGNMVSLSTPRCCQPGEWLGVDVGPPALCDWAYPKNHAVESRQAC
ncbi:MAG TPA: ABC transporter ATP-binding protein [Pirellulales bacterium]|nr:ABC transporter ATP-binding protein [Pirellulales bacterium]